MTSSLSRLSLAFLAAFLALALAAGYWSILRRDELLARDDNLRNYLAAARIRRGTIYDRKGIVLAETRGEPGDYTRVYAVPEAAPVVGYASLTYGVGGVEQAEDAVLRGEAGRTPFDLYWNHTLLGAPQIGRGVRLTLDAELQRVAVAALGRRTGAAVLLEVSTGDVLALASSPTFDPNTLDAEWQSLVADERSPLLNRATQGLYQPGGALQPILLAAALERRLASPDDPASDLDQPLEWRGGKLTCAHPPPATRHPPRPLTLADALTLSCPAPFAGLGLRFSPADLQQVFADFGLYNAPRLPLTTYASPPAPIPAHAAARRLAAAGLGDLQVSPLQMALVAAALANHGTLPPLRLVTEAQSADGAWSARTSPDHPRSALSTSSADTVVSLLTTSALGLSPLSGGGGEGRRMRGHASEGLTGPRAEKIGWYLGFAPADDPKYAIAVLVENETAQWAEEIGRRVLLAVLE